MRVRCLAPAKVNLCLYLGPARSSDGRHELVTVFQALSLADVVWLDVLDGDGPDEVRCPGVSGDNLAAAALRALRGRGWGGPRVRVTIEKRIPVAAGMAGGSADAAAALRLAMAIAPGRAEELDAIAAGLGADVPSQLTPGLSVGTGAGELVEPYPELGPCACLVLPSPHALSTPAVFREADRLGLPRSSDELALSYAEVSAGLSAGRLPDALLVNDLEPAAVSLCPSVGEALEDLRAVDATVTLVCGSGPTVAGMWWGEEAAEQAAAAADRLRERHPRAVTATPVNPGFAAAEPG